MYSGKKISELPWNAPIVGSEFLTMVQNGDNVRILASDLVSAQVDGLTTISRTVPLNASPYIILSTPEPLFLGAEYLVRVDQPSTGYVKLVKVLALYAGGNVLTTLYGTLENGILDGTMVIAVEAIGGDIVVSATQTGAAVGGEVTVKVMQFSVR